MGVIKDEQEEKLKPAGKGHALCSSGSYGPLACPSVYVVASYWLHYSRTVAFFFLQRPAPAAAAMDMERDAADAAAAGSSSSPPAGRFHEQIDAIGMPGPVPCRSGLTRKRNRNPADLMAAGPSVTCLHARMPHPAGHHALHRLSPITSTLSSPLNSLNTHALITSLLPSSSYSYLS